MAGGRELMRQGAPGDTTGDHVEDRVQDQAAVVFLVASALAASNVGSATSGVRLKVQQPFGVAVADLVPVGLGNRRVREESGGGGHVFERVVGAEQDVIGAKRLEGAQQGRAVTDSAGGDVEVVPQVLRRVAAPQFDAVVVVERPAGVQAPQHVRQALAHVAQQ